MSMEITNYSSTSAAFYSDHKNDVKKSEEKKTESKAENKVRKSVADELSYLSEKYENCTFIAVNYKKGMQYGSTATTNIAISPAFLKKMADDAELEKEYESYFADMQRLDAENIQSHEAQGRRIVAQGWAIDKDGGISRWGISEPKNVRHVGQEMNDYEEKLRKVKAEKKKQAEALEKKRVSEAESREKLLEKRKAGAASKESLTKVIEDGKGAKIDLSI